MSETSFTDGASRLRVEANPNRVRAMFAGHVIADTTSALTASEPGREPVQFFPRADVETTYLGKTARKIPDPVKGEASCYTLAMEGEIVEDAVCSYEDPSPAAEVLRNYLCFAEGHFEVYELTPSDMAAAPRATRVHRSVA
jgi:uncharacterized protein (DUF427 family)